MTREQKNIRLMLFIANEQLGNEFIDDLQSNSELVRELKRECKRREAFRKKYLEFQVRQMFNLSIEEVASVMNGLEEGAKNMVNDAIEQIEKEFNRLSNESK